MSFLTATHNSIPGITHIDSGIPGPHICISALTHGNEPVGLDVFASLVDEYEVGRHLRQGSLSLLVTCPETYNLRVRDGDETQRRFQHHNMNRIANQSFVAGSYEHERYHEIRPFLDTVDGMLDIHSTSRDDIVMGIADQSLSDVARRVCDVPVILLDPAMPRSGAMISSLVARGVPAIGMEAGQHLSPHAAERAVRVALSFLVEMGLLDEHFLPADQLYPEQRQFVFDQEILPETTDFQREIELDDAFVPVQSGQLYARDGALTYHNDSDDIRFVGLASAVVTPPDGVGFLFREVSLVHA